MDKFNIYFMLGDKDYSLQFWPQVPRVGERVLFYPKGEPKAFIVKDVLWNVVPNPGLREFTVNIKIIPDSAKACSDGQGDQA